MQANWAETFFQESDDLLAKIEAGALRMDQGDTSSELIDELFRAFHTLKGSGSMCGLTKLPSFTHHVETLLDQVRSGTVPASSELAKLVLASNDHIRVLIEVEQGAATGLVGVGEALIEALAQFGSLHTSGPEAIVASAPSEVPSSSQGKMRHWRIHFRPQRELMLSGGNPQLLLRDLSRLGSCEVVAHADKVPPLEAIEPTLCYLYWTVDLRADCSRDDILDVFLFVQEESGLQIEEIADGPIESPVEKSPVGASEDVSVSTVVAVAASAGAQQPKEAAVKGVLKESSVKVPSVRLDRLVNLVGELVMNQSRLTQVTSRLGIAELVNPVEEIERLVAELRDDVLSIRMLPIGSIFGRFRRVVHDLSIELGKEIDLVTQGEDTELDKSILDQIGDPLVHLLRNSIDHGIETPDVRLAAGKPRRGTVWLKAEHTGSDVVISIRDDGRGLDREAIRNKAIERRLIAADAVLTEKEICGLTLLPGFSTAKQVTSVSGRGVGMDAVKRQVDSLRGTVSIESEQGSGTRTSLSLPLTLAIIEGLVVEVGGDQFIFPMSAVMENVELHREDRQNNNGRNVLTIRGMRISYIDLRKLFEIGSLAPEISKVVIVKHEDQRVGFVVDRVLGTHQTVLQSLGHHFHSAGLVSGATIMGDGRVALVLDIAALVRSSSSVAAVRPLLADVNARLQDASRAPQHYIH
jgi:two-component system chemotaxis sensor kinase CheA